MSGHVQDRWFKKVVVDKKTVRVKTELYGIGMRYKVRHIVDGREVSKSFPDRHLKEAKDYLSDVESAKAKRTYVDERSGQVTFGDYAGDLIRTKIIDESTRQLTESRMRVHILPFFGSKQMGRIGPGVIREWNHEMSGKRLEDSTRQDIFRLVQSIFATAVEDKIVSENPCSAKSAKPAKPRVKAVVPWELDRAAAVKLQLPEEYRPMVDLGGCCGLRQGEIFGIAPYDVDSTAGRLHVARQIKRVRSRLVFGLPKNDKDRWVPMPAQLGESLASLTPVEITLPWENPDSDEMVTVPLLFLNRRRQAIHNCNFDKGVWNPALDRAGIPRGRENGMHALRHLYASVMLHNGVNIKAVSKYLGHSDPAFTLRVYMHLMEGVEDLALETAVTALRALHGLVAA